MLEALAWSHLDAAGMSVERSSIPYAPDPQSVTQWRTSHGSLPFLVPSNPPSLFPAARLLPPLPPQEGASPILLRAAGVPGQLCGGESGIVPWWYFTNTTLVMREERMKLLSSLAAA